MSRVRPAAAVILTERHPALLELVNAHRLAIDAILFENARKGQTTCRVLDRDGIPYVLKHRAVDVVSLRQEIDFYRRFSPRWFLPELVSFGSDFMLIRYYRSSTLRAFLLSRQDRERTLRVLESVLRFVSEFYDPSNYFIDDATRKALVSRFRKLLCSGQMHLQRSRVEERFFKILSKPTGWMLYRYIRRRRFGPGQAIHGDLHLNNILVMDDLSIKVIDWENTCIGSPLVDLLYLFPMIHKRCDLQISLEAIGLADTHLNRILTLFNVAVATNRKF